MKIDNYKDQINALCDLHHVEKLYVFGSSLKGEMQADSDIDLLVKFKKFNLADYFQNYMDFKRKLQKILKHKVDLVEEQALSNPILIKSINNNKKLIYG